MAGEEFLSQEEIDLLLQSLGKEEEEKGKEVSYRPFNVDELDKISPTRFVKLEQMINTWIGNAIPELKGMIFNLDSVSLSEVKIEKISDFVLKLSLPAAIALMNVEALGGRMYLVVDTRLIYTVISIIFGGPAQPYKVEGKNFTKFEIKVISNLVDILVRHLNDAWVDLIKEGRIEFAGLEENPKGLIMISRNEIVIVATLKVEIESFEGYMYLVIPMKTIEPIKDLLRTTETESGDFRDVIWSVLLSTPVLLEAVLPELSMSVAELVELREGDTINLDARTTERVVVKVSEVPFFLGILGESDGKKAVKIRSYIDSPLMGR